MVVGSLDARYRELGNRVVKICPSARLAVVPEAGHNVHQERTEEYARVVERFLNREDQKDHEKDSVERSRQIQGRSVPQG